MSITPFSDGYKAYVAGKKQNANPYRTHSIQWVKWDGGWISAERDAKRCQESAVRKEAAKEMAK